MNKIRLATLWVCFAMPLSWSQTIRGVILNHERQAIPNAHISVLNADIGAVSDENGKYTLKLKKGFYTLKISALQYACITKEVRIENDDITLNYVLKLSNETLDEVVVYAQKNAESSQKVPIAVSSLNAKRIEETRSWKLEDIVGIVPNYTYSELGVGFQQVQNIRGVQVFSENPAIATYVDGVNSLDILSGGFQFVDIERIEVLRGPQGTLYGRNTLGGVVNIVTKQPKNKPSGFYESSMGNLGLQRHGLGYKTPLISNTLFLGITGQYQYRDGFLTNDTQGTADPMQGNNGKRVGDEGSFYSNLFLKYLPDSQWSATLNIKMQNDVSNASSFFVSLENEVIALANPDRIYLGRIGEHQRSIFNVSLSAKYKGKSYKITSVSAYQNIQLRFNDIDFAPSYPSQVFASYRDGQLGIFNKPQDVISQEFRISSENKNDKLNYTAGVFYFNQTNYEPSSNNARIVNDSTLDVQQTLSENNGIAIFGELNYSIVPRIVATAGLRYESENRELTFTRFTDQSGTIKTVVPQTKRSGAYDAFLPKLSLRLEINESQSIYASYSRGFRAGGINGGVLPESVPQSFKPEYSNNYELGYKSNWFNRKLILNIAAFQINWNDLQFFNSFGNFVFAKANVGDAKSKGIEVEAITIPVKNLQLEASLGITNSEYKDFVLTRDIFNATTATVKTIQTDVSGNQLSNTPKHTLFLASQYQFPLIQNFTVSVRGEFKNLGTHFSDIQNDLKIDNYKLFNASVGVSIGTYKLSFWGRNLGDERYIQYGSADTSFGRNTRMSTPRTYGLTLNITF